MPGNKVARKKFRRTNKEMWSIKRHLEGEIIKIGKAGLFYVDCNGKIYHIEVLEFSESSIKYKILGKQYNFSKNALEGFRKIIKLNSKSEDITPALAVTC